MFGWLKAQIDKLAGSRNRPLSLVANWLANVLWLIDTSFLGLAQKAYGSNAVVYACLRLLSQSVPEAPLLAYTVTGDTESELPPTHPLRALIAKPNEMMTEYELWELVTLQMGLSGRSAWFKERDNARHIIGLWPLRPDRVGPIYAAPGITTNGDQPDNRMRVLWGYSYVLPDTGQPVPIPRNDMLVFNFPNPAGESGGIVEGLGPTQVLAHEISADNEATDFVGALLANAAMPTVALKVKAAIRDEAQAQLMKSQFRSEFGGSRRGVPAILDADTDIEMLGFNLRQLEFPDVRANAESRICAAFGVPAILVGVKVGLDRSTFSNMREARQFFAETTLSNYWRRYRDQYQNDVVSEFGDNIRVEFDTSVVRALAPRREQELAIAERAFTLGATTRNEYRAVLGMALVEGGDVFLVSGQTLAEPAGVPIKARVLDPPLLTAGEPLKKASDPREADEAALRVALEKLFGGFSDDMVGRIRRGEGLPEDELRAELGRLLEPRLVEIAVAEGVRQGAAVGVSFDLPVVNEAAVSWARGYTYDLVGGLTETTRGVVQNAIGRFYETPGMVRAELEALLAPAFGPLRAEMIAITETTRAYSAAQNDYQQMLGAQGIDMERVWVTRADELTCPLCSALNGKTEDAWDSGAPPRHVRCRCGSVLRRRERVAVPAGAAGEPIRPMPGPVGDKISAVFSEVPTRGKAADVVRTALDAIDGVHGLGDTSMPRIPITTFSGGTDLAEYRYSGGRAVDIRFKPNASRANMNVVHEVGHFIDHKGISQELGSGNWATAFSIREPGMAELWAATQNSQRISGLRALGAGPSEIPITLPDGLTLFHRVDKKYIKSLLDPQETFARSYAQYITTRSRNATLQAELKGLLGQERLVSDLCSQWDADDFEPIAEAFDNLFRKIGWLA